MSGKLYKNKYRIASNRMPGWDYSRNGYYFITIVTQNRVCNLGKIVDGKMILSDYGKIIENEWYKSFKIRNELFLNEFIIMPNHLHAIVVIYNNGERNENDVWNVETDGRPSLHSNKTVHSTEKPPLQYQKYNRNNPFFQHDYYNHKLKII